MGVGGGGVVGGQGQAEEEAVCQLPTKSRETREDRRGLHQLPPFSAQLFLCRNSAM